MILGWIRAESRMRRLAGLRILRTRNTVATAFFPFHHLILSRVAHFPSISHVLLFLCLSLSRSRVHSFYTMFMTVVSLLW